MNLICVKINRQHKEQCKKERQNYKNSNHKNHLEKSMGQRPKWRHGTTARWSYFCRARLGGSSRQGAYGKVRRWLLMEVRRRRWLWWFCLEFEQSSKLWREEGIWRFREWKGKLWRGRKLPIDREGLENERNYFSDRWNGRVKAAVRLQFAVEATTCHIHLFSIHS